MPRTVSPFPDSSDNGWCAEQASARWRLSGSGGSHFRTYCRPAPEALKRRIRSVPPPAVHKELQDAQKELRVLEEKLEDILRKKSVALKKLKDRHDKDKRRALQKLESTLRAEHEAKMKERKRVYEEEIEDACNQKRKQMREDQEVARQQRVVAHEAALTKLKLDSDAQASNDNEKPHSEILRQEIASIEANASQLNDDRSELIWLLKQVIKAENKNKKSVPKQHEPHIQSSKQA